MQMVSRPAFPVVVIADFANPIAFVHQLAADDAVRVELARIHVHVAHARMGASCVDEKIDGLLLWRAQNEAVVSGNDLMLVGLATVRAIIEDRARAWADILALVAFSPRTLTDEKAPMLAEIVAPRIRGIAGSALVENQRSSVDIARIGLVFPARAAHRSSGEVTIAPIVERLRIGESRRLLERKAQPRVHSVVGAATSILSQPRVGDDQARAEIGESFRRFFWPVSAHGFGRHLCGRRATRKPERAQEAFHHAVGLSARQDFSSRSRIEAIDGRDISHAVALKTVSNIRFMQIATNAREIVL